MLLSITTRKAEKDGCLIYLKKTGWKIKVITGFQFWEHENHPILLDNEDKFRQRFIYLHDNPVRAGFVREPQDWLYSSTMIAANAKGLLDLVRID